MGGSPDPKCGPATSPNDSDRRQDCGLAPKEALEAIDAKRDRQRIASAIIALAEDPRPHGSERLSGTKDRHRIRIGDHRVVYGIEDNVLTVRVVKIGHCRDVNR